ncbi:craniofacial development protein 2-like [Palaemon carinicauda]|uniref:craniofacial development protein 2-like n=1 Tax=Palaemon carinicauda TaxID=392227 RepID=UPI0035B5E042
MTPRPEKALTEWRAVNSRLLLAKFIAKQCNMSIRVCYAPTNDSTEKRVEEYHEELQRVIDEIPKMDMKIVIGDFNDKLRSNNERIENVTGVEGLGEVANENGARLIGFCSAKNLGIRAKPIRYLWEGVISDRSEDIVCYCALAGHVLDAEFNFDMLKPGECTIGGKS